jgi:hypothetical protein
MHGWYVQQQTNASQLSMMGTTAVLRKWLSGTRADECKKYERDTFIASQLVPPAMLIKKLASYMHYRQFLRTS